MDENKILDELNRCQTNKELKDFLLTQNIDKLIAFKNLCDIKYHNPGTPILDDTRYDLLKDYIISKKPEQAKVIGAPPLVGSEVAYPNAPSKSDLPFYLGSADKITEELVHKGKLLQWLNQHPAQTYIVSDKLDGVSCLLVSDEGDLKLYTRGDGLVGTDISHLSKVIQHIPKLSADGYLAVRGELIISRKDFEIFFRNKVINGRMYQNARNTVTGLIGSKSHREGLNLIQFVAYEVVVEKWEKSLKDQLTYLSNLGFKVVPYLERTSQELLNNTIVPTMVDNRRVLNLNNLKDIRNTYVSRSSNSEFDIDGLIVQPNAPYIRNTEGNPKYLFAFKMLLDEDIRQTTVIDVVWEVSKQGRLNPVIHVLPVSVAGITISKATGNNARYIADAGIGPGAVVEIIRSNEVIPKIHSVITPAAPKFPNVPYEWDNNRTFIFTKVADPTACVKLISEFFAKIGAKGISEGTVQKLFDVGYNTLFKILDLGEKEIAIIPGLGYTSAHNIKNSINEAMKTLTIPKLLGSCSVLGHGIAEKKVDLLFEAYPNILDLCGTISESELRGMLSKIKGFGEATYDKIAPNFKYACEFVERMKKYSTLSTRRTSGGPLTGYKFVFSGVRDVRLEDRIKDLGGACTTSVSGQTSALIVANLGKETGKIKDARSKGVRIYSFADFAQYITNLEQSRGESLEKAPLTIVRDAAVKEKIPVIVSEKPVINATPVYTSAVNTSSIMDVESYKSISRSRGFSTIGLEKLPKPLQTITITFGDQAENHAGMQKIGKLADSGFSLQDLLSAKANFERYGCECFILNLNSFNQGQGEPAYILVIRKAVNAMLASANADAMYVEQSNLRPDTKALMRGRVVNKHARHNLCFDTQAQEPDYERGKGRIVAYSQVPLLSEIQTKLPEFFGAKAMNLLGEGNYYFNPLQCGIGFHGDSERKRVIALRLGVSMPLHYQWFHRFKPVGERAIIELQHGDMYMMSEKAVGTDWKRSSILTLRHAAGCEKYTTIEEK